MNWEAIEWLRSPEGEEWSRDRMNPLETQGHREGKMFTLEPDLFHRLNNAYTPWGDLEAEYYAEYYIFEPDSVKGLSSPA